MKQLWQNLLGQIGKYSGKLWRGTTTTLSHIWQNSTLLAVEAVTCALCTAVLPPLGLTALVGCLAVNGYQIYSETKKNSRAQQNALAQKMLKQKITVQQGKIHRYQKKEIMSLVYKNRIFVVRM